MKYRRGWRERDRDEEQRSADKRERERGRQRGGMEGGRETRQENISISVGLGSSTHNLEDENPWKALVFLPSSRHTHGLAYRWADRD